MTTDLEQLDDLLDLDADRQSRAAAREGRNKPMRIRFGGEQIAALPVEMPLDVLSPLREIDDDLALMVRAVMQAMRAQGEDVTSMAQATELVVDLLVSNPNLPTTLLNVAAKVGRGLLGDQGYEKYMAQRPSREDIGALVKGVFKFYGLTLGESSAPSDSPGDGGATSNTTSDQNSESTPAASTQTPATPPQDGQQPMAS